jgi:histidine triad (HIT) family protein
MPLDPCETVKARGPMLTSARLVPNECEEKMEECVFCNIQRGLAPAIGDPIHEDDLVYAHHYYGNEDRTYLGHLMLETKRHTPGCADLTSAEAQAMGLLIARLSSALKACTDAEKVYAVFYGEVTPHLHVHLTARYRGTPAEYLRWNVEDWPGAPRGTEDEIAALCAKLRAELATGRS